MYTYRIGLIPRDSSKNLSDLCKKNKCTLEVAGSEDGMNDVYIEADSIDKIKSVARQSWFRFYPEFIYDCEKNDFI